MNKWMMRIAGAALVAALVLGVLGQVSAQDDSGQDPTPVRGIAALGQLIDVMAYLSEDLTHVDIRQGLLDGQTLAEIAEANGLSVDDVVTEALAYTDDRLSVAVVSGRLTQEEADELLAEAEAFYPEAMQMTLADLPSPLTARFEARFDSSLMGVLADAAGMTPREMWAEMHDPLSMAAVAEALGLDAGEILDTAETQITDAINQAVADGQLTQDQADALLDGLRARLEERFNAEHPFLMGMGQARGMMSGWGDWGFGGMMSERGDWGFGGMMSEWWDGGFGGGMQDFHQRGPGGRGNARPGGMGMGFFGS